MAKTKRTETANEVSDAVVVGGGPAGLSAALVLGRCCRRVCVIDAGRPRNWASSAMWGYLSQDGVSPKAFRDRAHRELARYGNVRIREGRVVDIAREADGDFAVRVAGDAAPTRARAVLVATGVIDRLPAIPGLEPLFGASVFRCPYCDGWQFRGKRLAAYGKGSEGMALARALLAWSRSVVWLADGPAGLSAEDRAACDANEIAVVETPVLRFEADGTALREARLVDGRGIPCDALFVDSEAVSQSDLVRRLGCAHDEEGDVSGDRYEATTVEGVFVAGNIVGDVQLAIVAAAEGAKAAFGINRYLTGRDFHRRASTHAHGDFPDQKATG
jgi:thioredoxin reductase